MYNNNELLEISKLIALRSLKTIAKKGNMNAVEVLETYAINDTVLDDIIQTVALAIIENNISVTLVKCVSIKDNEYAIYYKPHFDYHNDQLTVYRAASNEFYKMKERESRYLYKEKYLDDQDENGNYFIDTILYDEAEKAREREENDMETRDIINQVYQTLTDKQRTVFRYVLSGYNQREIAKNTGVTHQAVMKHRKAILRKCLTAIATV